MTKTKDTLFLIIVSYQPSIPNPLHTSWVDLESTLGLVSAACPRQVLVAALDQFCMLDVLHGGVAIIGSASIRYKPYDDLSAQPICLCVLLINYLNEQVIPNLPFKSLGVESSFWLVARRDDLYHAGNHG